MISNIVFYNQWHNGDIFSGKAYLSEIIKSLPEVNFVYAHSSHEKVMADLSAKYMSDKKLHSIITRRKDSKLYLESETLFLNTWIGAWRESSLITEEHGNWAFFHRMYSIMYGIINELIKEERLNISENQLNYIPTTDFDRYETKLADNFLQTTKGKKLHLFCNGHVRAEQSALGLMEPIIDKLAELFSNDILICTAKFETNRRNVVFTDDIFKLENDINEIAYLSTHCRTIIGKNSGPYMFCHITQNFNSSNVCFVSLSRQISDSYPAHTLGFNCNYLHHTRENLNGVLHSIYYGMSIDSSPEVKKLSSGRCMPI